MNLDWVLERENKLENENLITEQKADRLTLELSPESLMSILEAIKRKRGPHELPIPISEDNYFRYLAVSDINIGVIRRKLVYKLNIAILELNNYEAYRIIPAPQLVKENTFLYTSAPHDYIITNDEKLLYTPSDEAYLKTCKSYGTIRFCKRAYSKYRISGYDNCLSKIISEPKQLKKDDCDPKVIGAKDTIWIQLKDNQRWLYAAPKPETLRILCETRVTEATISGTQLLWIKPGCTGTSNNVILHSQLDIEFSSSKSYSPLISYNFSDEYWKINNITDSTIFEKIHFLESPD
ncbi:uncharacterized protein LOC107272206 [Cephus cinctus]|uniref:Uncharacterized protein LOC107272206 n=1 Tax=Cephus cinctus TaxID=211228 RepID=A0AAJ7C8P3_CEPCN|nr:uncharacterized protein LOC107272206 [Cephus cinctus]